jgi:hypothetical protein
MLVGSSHTRSATAADVLAATKNATKAPGELGGVIGSRIAAATKV